MSWTDRSRHHRMLFLPAIVLVHMLLLHAVWQLTHPARPSGMAEPLRTLVLLEMAPEPPVAAAAPRAQDAQRRKELREVYATTAVPEPASTTRSDPPVLSAPPGAAASAPLRLDESVMRAAVRGLPPPVSALQPPGPAMQPQLNRALSAAVPATAQGMAQARERALKRDACRTAQAVGGDQRAAGDTGSVGGAGGFGAAGGIGGGTRWTFTVQHQGDCPP